MKDFLKQQIDQRPNDLSKRSLTREYLQARVLQALQDNGVFLNWAFFGGTALRFLYGIPRYSEDLDFSLVDPTQDCEFEAVLLRIKSLFHAENYDITIKAAQKKTVMSAFLKFPGILYEMGISPLKSETLSIKFEVDTNPPAGAQTETTITRRFVTVNVNHYNKASLFAGKLHAILSRQYTKGRDLYDLVWYLSDKTWPCPNLALLNTALQQTGWSGQQVTNDNLYDILSERISGLNWTNVLNDMMPFLERSEDASLITKDNILSLLKPL
jgi:predicted nucleotidyltransferase component of viral defense system